MPYEAQAAGGALRLAYADPPYPGTAARYYGKEPNYAGEVDHAALIASLASYDGWALSTSERALRDILPLCPKGARLCPWVKPIGASAQTYGLHNAWEALIVFGGRQLRPGVRDWLSAMPARKGGDLPGRKSLAFCAFLFRALGALPGDELVDLFPGTGIVGRAWAETCRRSPVDERRDMSPVDERRQETADRRQAVLPWAVTEPSPSPAERVAVGRPTEPSARLNPHADAIRERWEKQASREEKKRRVGGCPGCTAYGLCVLHATEGSALR